MAIVLTVKDLISRSLRLLNVMESGDALESSEMKDAFDVLNMMISDWNNERLMLYGWMNGVYDITAGQEYYTIGVNQDIDVVRPKKIVKAFTRVGSGVDQTDYPIEIITNLRFQELTSKNVQNAYPQYLYYNSEFPFGKIYLWGVPAVNTKLGLTQYSQLLQFDNPAQEISLPDGYPSCICYNLAVEMAPEFGKPIDPIIVKKAVDTKMNIKRMNTEPLMMDTDPALMPRYGTFNIQSGSWK